MNFKMLKRWWKTVDNFEIEDFENKCSDCKNFRNARCAYFDLPIHERDDCCKRVYDQIEDIYLTPPEC